NIHKKEKVIEELFADSLALKTFENVERYPKQALDMTKSYLDDELVLFYVYKKNVPIFWSSNLIVPPSDRPFIQDATFINTEPRSYIVKKKDIGQDMSVMAIILVRRAFNHSNPYLTNRFYKNIIASDNLEIAQYSDNEIVRNVYSKGGTYLFSVKFKEGKYHNVYLTIQLLSWVLGSIILLSLINRVCITFAKKG
ncbi:hypothetical protein M8994_21970, partial [Brucella sp. 21LCYQ03]|nr:hypothetical protein [Brucella sp. 21LCYQ03]